MTGAYGSNKKRRKIMSWRNNAACRDKDPELFFPVGKGKSAQEQIQQAKAVCQCCPVSDHCLQAAQVPGTVGVWGATSEDERRAMNAANAHAR